MEREKIISYLKGFEYHHIRSIYADYVQNVEVYDDEVIELLRNYPILCFEFEVCTDLDFFNAKWEKICYIPPGIKSFKKLRLLELQFNLLSSLPNEFAELESLESIGLDGNRFTEFPMVLTRLPRLSSLRMQNNRMSIIPEEIKKISNTVHHLLLDNNQLTCLPECIKEFHKLAYLSLTGNQISESEQEKIRSWLPKTEIIFGS